MKGLKLNFIPVASCSGRRPTSNLQLHAGGGEGPGGVCEEAEGGPGSCQGQ